MANSRQFGEFVSLDAPVEADAQDVAEAMVEEEVFEFYQPDDTLRLADIIADSQHPDSATIAESPKIESVLLEVLGVLMLFAAAALASRRLLHGLLGWVARQGHEESFVLVSLCVVVAAAAAAHAVGVSAALGAFLAGMVLGESDFRHHMESHLKPFRDVLSGVFFVTIGLQLDGAQILSAPLTVLAWLAVLVPVKIVLNTLALRATRLSALDAWRTGIDDRKVGDVVVLSVERAGKSREVRVELQPGN